MDNYKGLYYNESKEQKFYEAGAHFSYEKLYKALLYLKEEQNKKQKSMERQKDIYQNQNQNTNNNYLNTNLNANSGVNSIFKINDLFQNNKNKPKTRNVGNTFYNNNPNTQIKNVNNKIHHNKNLSNGLPCNKKKYISNSRNYTNDYNLFYNRTTNLINNEAYLL